MDYVYYRRIEKRIKKGYTAEAICYELNITVEELYLNILELRKSGSFYFQNIEENCDITFSKKKETLDSDVVLFIPDGDFSFITLSDPHVGSMYDCIDRFRSIEEFANDDANNIKMIVNNGDNIDGPDHENQSVGRRLPDIASQLNEFVMEYIYFKGPNICILGGPEHDTGNDARTEDGYNLYRTIKEFRPDIKVFGSATGTIRINNQKIVLCHNINDKNVKAILTDDQWALSGHSHAYYNHSFYTANGPVIRMVAPSVSNLPLHNNKTPGFLKATLKISNYQITQLLVDNYTFEGAGAHILYNGQVDYKIPYNKKEANNIARKRKRK